MSSASSSTSSSLPDLTTFGSYSTLRLRWCSDNGVLNVHIAVGSVNAMSQLFWSEIRTLCTRIASSSDVRCVWLTAEGKVFTAGLDLQDHKDSFLSPDFKSSSSSSSSSTSDPARRALRLLPAIESYQASFTALESLPQPVVVSIQGACIGGGVDLITACDIRLASKSAYFSIKEVDIGMAADVGTLQRLPKVMSNHSLMKEWCYTGRKVTAEEALSAGLISHLYQTQEELNTASLTLCRTIASKSPLAITGTKMTLNYSRDHSVRDGLEFIARWNATALQSADLQRAMKASFTKQQPIYSNL